VAPAAVPAPSYSVAANTATESRSATLTIGGQSHAITQDGRTPTICTYNLSPDKAEFNKDATTGTFAVTAPDNCAWTAVSSASWLVVSSGSQGSGNGTVAYTATRNTEPTDRTATIAVANRTFPVTQFGDYPPEPVCEYSVAPVNLQPCMPGGTRNATVTT
jgi:hypothetical protein